MRAHPELREPQLVNQPPPPLVPTHLPTRVLDLLRIRHLLIVPLPVPLDLDARLEARDEPGEEQDGLVHADDVLERGGALLEALTDAVKVGHALEEVVLLVPPSSPRLGSAPRGEGRGTGGRGGTTHRERLAELVLGAQALDEVLPLEDDVAVHERLLEPLGEEARPLRRLAAVEQPKDRHGLGRATEAGRVRHDCMNTRVRGCVSPRNALRRTAERLPSVRPNERETSRKEARRELTVQRPDGTRVEAHVHAEVVRLEVVGAKVGRVAHEVEVRHEGRDGRHGDVLVELGCMRRTSEGGMGQSASARGGRGGKKMRGEEKGGRTARDHEERAAQEAVQVLLDVALGELACSQRLRSSAHCPSSTHARQTSDLSRLAGPAARGTAQAGPRLSSSLFLRGVMTMPQRSRSVLSFARSYSRALSCSTTRASLAPSWMRRACGRDVV